MPEGSKWKLYIPSELAYGARGAGEMISYCSPLGRTTTPGPFLFSSRNACPCSIATALILDSNSSKYLFTISRASLWLIAESYRPGKMPL